MKKFVLFMFVAIMAISLVGCSPKEAEVTEPEKKVYNVVSLVNGNLGDKSFFDQLLKIWVKTHMVIGEDIPIFGKWGMLHFIENNGMAFGMEMGGKPGKLILSIFRIIAITAIAWFLNSIIKKNAYPGLILAVSAILAGAIGNIIDRLIPGRPGVVDFISVGRFPVFNIADSAITCGVFAILLFQKKMFRDFD